MQRIVRNGWRQLSVLVVLLIALIFLVRNLFVMQVLQADSAQMLAHYHDEVSSPQIEQPVRGTIIDYNGMPLVNTVTVFKLGAYPSLIDNKQRAAHAITNIIFPLPAGHAASAAAQVAHQKHYTAILAQLSLSYSYVCLAGDDSFTCPLQQDISTPQADQIRGLKMAGFDLEARNQPNYPNGPVAAHVLGFVNYIYPKGQAVDQGRYGLEQYYNNLLRGVSGHVAIRQDTLGDLVRVGPGSNTAGLQGAQLRLWIDSYIQYQVEQILFQTVQKWNAQSGTVVVERPSDGAILAMASWPRYEPRHWQDIVKANPHNGSTRFLNPAVSNIYDPGSTF
ncbi:MAG TPA: penicillin-binding transpeptidase domain-containing protein, partial [Chloroflexota bacterium]|nr:penicillin-binding transpeptidase domain-containing protein [Chloroflexota bacterium]